MGVRHQNQQEVDETIYNFVRKGRKYKLYSSLESILKITQCQWKFRTVFNVFVILCVYVRGWGYVQKILGVNRGQKRQSCPLEPELRAVVSNLRWLPGAQLRFPGRPDVLYYLPRHPSRPIFRVFN